MSLPTSLLSFRLEWLCGLFQNHRVCNSKQPDANLRSAGNTVADWLTVGGRGKASTAQRQCFTLPCSTTHQSPLHFSSFHLLLLPSLLTIDLDHILIHEIRRSDEAEPKKTNYFFLDGWDGLVPAFLCKRKFLNREGNNSTEVLDKTASWPKRLCFVAVDYLTYN
eukprot:scaffold912_cov187-Ochromonas_danica.AAC.18